MTRQPKRRTVMRRVGGVLVSELVDYPPPPLVPTKCAQVLKCGHECCDTEIAICDRPIAHTGHHRNTIEWKESR